MSVGYRAWPAAVLTGAALTAACLVVGEQALQTSDGCRGLVSRFTATPVAGLDSPVTATLDSKSVPIKVGIGRTTATGSAGRTTDRPQSADQQISGCLDVHRIESPAPVPAPDGRA